jgi:hypothetical protein
MGVLPNIQDGRTYAPNDFFDILYSQRKSRNNPTATWEPLFFGAINQLAGKAGWKPLREASLPSQSLEVRIWIGFGMVSLQGYSLRQDGSVWTGHYVVENQQQTNAVTVRDISPKGGWDKLWTRLVQLDVLTLPDSSTLRDEVLVIDGVCYVVEINKDGRYRTYEYSNPKFQKWPEAKKIDSIGQTLQDEFIEQ